MPLPPRLAGQRSSVRVRRLWVEGTVEQRIVELQAQKLSMAKRILSDTERLSLVLGMQ